VEELELVPVEDEDDGRPVEIELVADKPVEEEEEEELLGPVEDDGRPVEEDEEEEATPVDDDDDDRPVDEATPVLLLLREPVLDELLRLPVLLLLLLLIRVPVLDDDEVPLQFPAAMVMSKRLPFMGADPANMKMTVPSKLVLGQAMLVREVPSPSSPVAQRSSNCNGAVISKMAALPRPGEAATETVT